jgi:hypothetical protein
MLQLPSSRSRLFPCRRNWRSSRAHLAPPPWQRPAHRTSIWLEQPRVRGPKAAHTSAEAVPVGNELALRLHDAFLVLSVSQRARLPLGRKQPQQAHHLVPVSPAVRPDEVFVLEQQDPPRSIGGLLATPRLEESIARALPQPQPIDGIPSPPTEQGYAPRREGTGTGRHNTCSFPTEPRAARARP